MQDGKNLIMAIVLCLLVVVGWSYLADYMGWVVKPDPAEIAKMEAAQAEQAQKAQAEAEAKQKAQAEPLPAFTPAPGVDVTVDAPLYKAVLHSGGGVLRSFELKKYTSGLDEDSPHINMVDPQTAAVAPLGLVINGQPSWSTGKWALESDSGVTVAEGGKGVVRLVGEVDNLRVTRELTFNSENYLISEKVSLATLGTDTRSVRVRYTVAADTSNAANTNYDAMRVAWDNGGSLGEETSTDKLTKEGVEASGKLYWAGPMSTYFLSAVMPGDADEARMVGRMQGSVYRVALEPKEVVVAPGQETTLEVSYWMGPKERKMLAAVSDQLALSVDLGMFSIIAKGLLWLLEFFQQYTHNWGLSIIMLTIVIKAVFWPLTAKSYSSMEKMKKLQPMMANIREKYKDDKEAMNKEVMALYKTYGVNPASGCVPILVQLPVFFGLYQALLTSIELRHAPFITYLPGTDLIWLADLSSKDPYYITPIIMGITMFLQQKMSPPATDPTQQKIMMFLPIVFTALFLSFPSGLVVYWLVNNILSIAQQWRMGRRSKLLAQ